MVMDIITCGNQDKAVAYLNECLPPIEYRRIEGGRVSLVIKMGLSMTTTGNLEPKSIALYEFLEEHNLLRKFIEEVFNGCKMNYRAIGNTFGNAFPRTTRLYRDIDWGEIAYESAMNFRRLGIR